MAPNRSLSSKPSPFMSMVNFLTLSFRTSFSYVPSTSFSTQYFFKLRWYLSFLPREDKHAWTNRFGSMDAGKAQQNLNRVLTNFRSGCFLCILMQNFLAAFTRFLNWNGVKAHADYIQHFCCSNKASGQANKQCFKWTESLIELQNGFHVCFGIVPCSNCHGSLLGVCDAVLNLPSEFFLRFGGRCVPRPYENTKAGI